MRIPMPDLDGVNGDNDDDGQWQQHHGQRSLRYRDYIVRTYFGNILIGKRSIL